MTDRLDEELAEQLHKWYLEATEKLSPEDFNFDAQKGYEDLTQGQKFIDRYIAEKLRKEYIQISEVLELIGEDEKFYSLSEKSLAPILNKVTKGVPKDSHTETRERHRRWAYIDYGIIKGHNDIRAELKAKLGERQI